MSIILICLEMDKKVSKERNFRYFDLKGEWVMEANLDIY